VVSVKLDFMVIVKNQKVTCFNLELLRVSDEKILGSLRINTL
jgi:hypothetical protein